MRRYRATVSEYCSGYFKDFWFLKNAKNWAKSHAGNNLTVEIEDRWKKKKLIIRNWYPISRISAIGTSIRISLPKVKPPDNYDGEWK